jgi:hypothetical protein
LEPEWIDVVHNGIDPTVYRQGGSDDRRLARQKMGLPLTVSSCSTAEGCVRRRA